MSNETKEQQLQWLLNAWEKHPTDNFGSSLARVMGAYGYDYDSLEAYLDVEGGRAILNVQIGTENFLFPAHMYLPHQAERLLADIDYTLRNYY